DGGSVDGVGRLLHFLVDRRKRIVCLPGARALATIRESIAHLGRILEVPVGRIPKFSIVLGVSRCQRTRPTPMRDVIPLNQRLESGAELDQYGVRALRGSGW